MAGNLIGRSSSLLREPQQRKQRTPRAILFSFFTKFVTSFFFNQRIDIRGSIGILPNFFFPYMRLPCLVGFVSIRSVNGGDFSDRIFVECRFRSHSKPLGSSTIRKPKWFYWFFFLSLSLSPNLFLPDFVVSKKRGEKTAFFFGSSKNEEPGGPWRGGAEKKKKTRRWNQRKKNNFEKIRR